MFTVLMFVILIIIYALMVGLVKFTEHVVARNVVSMDGGAAAGVVDTGASSTER